MKYSCSLLIPKSDTAGVAEIEKAIQTAVEKGKSDLWKGKVPKFRYSPLRDGDEELKSGEKTDRSYEGHYFLNCSSNDAPGLVDRKAKPAFDDDLIYAGCYVRADINAFPYSNGGNNGVGWGLNNVMFWADGERLDGRQRAEDAFGGFATDNDDGHGQASETDELL